MPDPRPHRLDHLLRCNVVEIVGGRGDAPMAELLGDDPDVHALDPQLGGVGVAKAVGVDPLTCPPKTEPVVVRVPMTSGRGQEILNDETEPTHTRADHRQVA